MTSAPHLVVFTGSGISAESGIQTFRASDGLWEDHPVEEVATPQGGGKTQSGCWRSITSAVIRSAARSPTPPIKRWPRWSRKASESA